MRFKATIFVSVFILALLSLADSALSVQKNIFDSPDVYKTGSKTPIDTYSTEYTDDAKLIEKGGCQLIAYSGAPFRVKEVGPGNYQLLPKGSKGMEVGVERITDATHPFSPRNDSDWKERYTVGPLPGRCFGIDALDPTILGGAGSLDGLGSVGDMSQLGGVGSQLKDMASKLSDIQSKLSSFSGPLAEQLNGQLDALKGQLSGLSTGGLKPGQMATQLGDVTEKLGTISDQVPNLPSTGSVVNGATGAASGAANNTAGGAVSGVNNAASGILKNSTSGIASGVNNATSGVTGGINDTTKGITNAASGAINNATGGVTGVAKSTIGNLPTNLPDGLPNLPGGIPTSVPGVGSLAEGQLGAQETAQISQQLGAISGQAQQLISGINTLKNVGRSFTQICGTDKLKYVGGKRAWEGSDDFMYYKQPIERSGRIMVTAQRKSDFDARMRACFLPCYAATKAADISSSKAARICCDKCQYRTCRSVILPPVAPKNKLKMTYGFFQKDGPDYMQTNEALPRITDSDRKSNPPLYDNGLGWYTSLPKDKFGYNMPPLTHLPNGEVGGKALKPFSRGSWEEWRTVISGVNSYFKPDETNPSETGVYNMSAQHGGWNELVLYQARCQQLFGLNCICDYFKNFYLGSSLGYALSRYDSYISLNNMPKITEETRTYKGRDYKVRVDKSDRMKWKFETSFLKGKYPFPGLMGQNMKEGRWPGVGPWFPGRGLSNAKKGDIIFYDLDIPGKYRPWHAAFVEKGPHKIGDNTCVQISESDSGVLRDIAGNTENWGKVNLRNICINSINISGVKEDGGSDQLKECTNIDYAYCYEKDWNSWGIYRPFNWEQLDKYGNPKLIDTRAFDARFDK